jgi:hypothetical protein
METAQQNDVKINKDHFLIQEIMMAIVAQKHIFSWESVDNLPDLARIVPPPTRSGPTLMRWMDPPFQWGTEWYWKGEGGEEDAAWGKRREPVGRPQLASGSAARRAA